MPSDTLRDYIAAERVAGYSTREIRAALSKAGYGEIEINQALGKQKHPLHLILSLLLLLGVLGAVVFFISQTPTLQQSPPIDMQALLPQAQQRCVGESLDHTCLSQATDDVTLCSKHERILDREECILSYALTHLMETSVCSSITRNDLRLACEQIQNIPDDIGACASLSPEDVPFCEAFVKRSAEPCFTLSSRELQQECRDTVLLLNAVETNTIGACIQLSTLEQQLHCRAAVSKDMQVCEQASQLYCTEKAPWIVASQTGSDRACASVAPELRQSCLLSTLFHQSDVAQCDDLVEPYTTACRAILTTNPTLCLNIPDDTHKGYSDLKDTCYQEIAARTGTKEYCVNIQHPTLREECQAEDVHEDALVQVVP